VLPTDRNTIVDRPWILQKVDNHAICEPFDCNDEELNDYFHVDVVKHKENLLTESYCLTNEEHPDYVVALVDLCNDAIRLEDIRNMNPKFDLGLDREYSSLPAVKISRLGVQKELQDNNIGSQILNMIKKFFLTENRTGCRFITVDSYIEPRVINFYENNEFLPLKPKEGRRDNLPMYFDLKRLILP